MNTSRNHPTGPNGIRLEVGQVWEYRSQSDLVVRMKIARIEDDVVEDESGDAWVTLTYDDAAAFWTLISQRERLTGRGAAVSRIEATIDGHALTVYLNAAPQTAQDGAKATSPTPEVPEEPPAPPRPAQAPATPDGLDPHAWQCALATYVEHPCVRNTTASVAASLLPPDEVAALANDIRRRDMLSKSTCAYYRALEPYEPARRGVVRSWRRS